MMLLWILGSVIVLWVVASLAITVALAFMDWRNDR